MSKTLTIQWSDDLTGLLSETSAWSSLTRGVPFRHPSWIGAWWNHLSEQATPAILVARDSQNKIRGLLPLYQRASEANSLSKIDASGRTLHSIADGNTCSDYVSILAAKNEQVHVAQQMADFLGQRYDSSQDGWHSIVIDGIVEGDIPMEAFFQRLSQRNVPVHCQSRMSTWYCPAAESWDAYLMQYSSNSRSKKRRVLKRISNTPGLTLETAESIPDVHRMLDELIVLHQDRWKEAGELGSFVEPEFRDFVHAAAESFFKDGKLWSVVIRLKEVAVASAILFIGDDQRAYVYTTGTDMGQRKLEPGKLLSLYLIEQVHERGLSGIDFMRGNESYKALLADKSKRVMEARIASPAMISRLQHTAWLTQFEMKQFLRRRLGRSEVEVVEIPSPAKDPGWHKLCLTE